MTRPTAGPRRRRSDPLVAAVLVVLVGSACGQNVTTLTPSPSAPASSAASGLASFSPPDLDGRIVFTRAGGQFGDETVFAANADGTDERQLSDLDAACCPWATRDGSRVLFAASAPDERVTTTIMNFDGSDPVVIELPDDTLNLGPGPFSPDGSLIAFEGFDATDESRNGIYIGRSSDGGDLRRITQDGGIPGDFSPDGTQLVFFKGSGADTPDPGSLFIVNANGNGERQLTNGIAVLCCFNYRWSPDGSRILFADVGGTLWVINPDGTDITRLFKDTEGRYAITPTWSPDGSKVMFALDPDSNPFAHPANGLYVVDADGTGLAQVIGGNDFKRSPTWIP